MSDDYHNYNEKPEVNEYSLFYLFDSSIDTYESINKLEDELRPFLLSDKIKKEIPNLEYDIDYINKKLYYLHLSNTSLLNEKERYEWNQYQRSIYPPKTQEEKNEAKYEDYLYDVILDVQRVKINNYNNPRGYAIAISSTEKELKDKIKLLQEYKELLPKLEIEKESIPKDRYKFLKEDLKRQKSFLYGGSYSYSIVYNLSKDLRQYLYKHEDNSNYIINLITNYYSTKIKSSSIDKMSLINFISKQNEILDFIKYLIEFKEKNNIKTFIGSYHNIFEEKI